MLGNYDISNCKREQLREYINDNNGWHQIAQDTILGNGTWIDTKGSQCHVHQRFPCRLLFERFGGNYAGWIGVLREELHQLGPAGSQNEGRGTGPSSGYH